MATETKVEDCIYKRGGRYTVRVRVPGHGQTRQSAPTLAAARELRDRLRHDKHSGSYTPTELRKLTVSEWIDRYYLPSVVWDEGNRKNNLYAIEKHIRPTFGTMPLRSVKRRHVQVWVNGLVEKGFAANSVSRYLNILTAIFTAAVGEALNETPCTKIKRPTVSKAVESVLSPEQVSAIAEQMDEWARLFVWIGAMSGARIGEILGLSIDRIDFEAGTITYDRQRRPDKTFGPTKTRKTREVPVPDDLLAMIKAHVAEHGLAPDGTLFWHHRQTLSHSTVYSRVWERAVAGLELPEDAATPHALRHFYASVLIAANLNPKEIQERLGHATISETMDTYGHLFPKAADSTRSAFDGVFAPRLTVAA